MTDDIDALIDELPAPADTDRPTEGTPELAILMGSDPDPDTMAGAHDALRDLGFAEQTDSDHPP